MQLKAKKETIATLLKAERPDLANAIAKIVTADDAETLKMVTQALVPYGASLTDDNHIQRNGKVMGVSVAVKSGKLQFISPAGDVLFSGPIKSQAVEKFVESFWFWKKSGITAATRSPFYDKAYALWKILDEAASTLTTLANEAGDSGDKESRRNFREAALKTRDAAKDITWIVHRLT